MSAQGLRPLHTEPDYGDEDYCGASCSTANESKSNCLKLFEFSENSVLAEFFRDTSLHGFQYVGQKGCHTIQRAFWVCTILGVILFSSYLIRIGVVGPLLSNPILITFHSSEVTVNQIPFPAFSICNINQAKKSEVEKLQRVVIEYLANVESNRTAEYLEFGGTPIWDVEALKVLSNLCTHFKFFSKMCGFVRNTDFLAEIMNHTAAKVLNFSDYESHHHFSSFKHMSDGVGKSLMKLVPDCSDIILRCLWRNEEVSCNELFAPIATRAGSCCAFNMIPRFVMRGYSRNDSGLSSFERHLNDSVVEAWRNWDIDKNLLNPSAKSESKLEYPLHQMKAGVRNGLSILVNPKLSEYSCVQGNGRGFRVQVHSPLAFPHIKNFGSGIGPNEEVFLGVIARITTADPKEIKGYSFEKRQCYFLGEKVLNSFKFYRKQNCIDECIADETWARCGCLGISQPSVGNRTYCVSSPTIRCALEIDEEMRKTGIRQKCKTCLPSCTQLDYTSDISKMPMRDDVGLWKKRSNTSSGVDELWANESLSIIHVFLASDFVESRMRKSLSGFKAILADTGGLLGFTIGFGVLSLVEPLYFFTLRYYFEKKVKAGSSFSRNVSGNDTSLRKSSFGKHEQKLSSSLRQRTGTAVPCLSTESARVRRTTGEMI